MFILESHNSHTSGVNSDTESANKQMESQIPKHGIPYSIISYAISSSLSASIEPLQLHNSHASYASEAISDISSILKQLSSQTHAG